MALRLHKGSQMTAWLVVDFQDLRTHTKETGLLDRDSWLKGQFLVKKPRFCVSPGFYPDFSRDVEKSAKYFCNSSRFRCTDIS